MDVTEFFAGIGAIRQAMKNKNIKHEVKYISEYDKYAIKSYNAVHGESNNLGDINSIFSVPYTDMWTYGFPCQDISVAGKQEGIKEGTRSGLLLRFEQILKTSVELGEQPKFLLMENVKNLVGKKHKKDFDDWLGRLENLGYNNYWQVLNAKYYGIPQNRERVFCLSIRKDIDNGFEFPEKQELKLRLRDVLEIEVDQKFYLKEEQYQNLIKNLPNWNTNPSGKGMNGNVNRKDLADTITTNKGEGQKILIGDKIRKLTPKEILEPVIAASRGRNPQNPSDRTPVVHTEQRLEVNKQGISNTLTSVQKDNYVLEPKTKRLMGIFDKEGKIHQAGSVWDKEGLSPTLDTMQGGWRQPSIISDLENFKIRKLTPKECWRLMGFKDEQFEKAEKVCSNTQLYKQAGNSICVPVLEEIFKKMIEYGYLNKDGDGIVV